MKKMSKIVLFGNERLATGITTDVPVLQALIAAGYDVVAVVSNYEPGTSRKSRELEIAGVAARHNIPLLTPAKPADILESLRSMKPDAAVLVAYGRIVPQSIIDVFPHGIINIHPSLLPLHRGPTPIESVILEGATRTGVSIMSLQQKMDAGPIYGQSEVSLGGTETKQELANLLLDLGTKMLTELLPGILDGTIVALPQDHSHANYDQLIKKEDGALDFRKPAVQLEREIRAYAGWPKSRTTLGQTEVIVTSADAVASNKPRSELSSDSRLSGRESISFYKKLSRKSTTGQAPSNKPGTIFKTPDSEIAVITGEGILLINSLKPAGKREMSAQEFLAGNRGLLQNI